MSSEPQGLLEVAILKCHWVLSFLPFSLHAVREWVSSEAVSYGGGKGGEDEGRSWEAIHSPLLRDGWGASQVGLGGLQKPEIAEVKRGLEDFLEEVSF